MDAELTLEIMVHHDWRAQERCDMCDIYPERDSLLVVCFPCPRRPRRRARVFSLLLLILFLFYMRWLSLLRNPFLPFLKSCTR